MMKRFGKLAWGHSGNLRLLDVHRHLDRIYSCSCFVHEGLLEGVLHT